MCTLHLRPQHPTDATAQNSPPEYLGHPRGLAFLFATEMWERFSYYGMRALFVLYMVKCLLQSDQAGAVAGYGATRAALEALFGSLSVQALASQIYGLYTGLVYLTPIFGGLLADRYLGQRRTVIIGAVLMAVGHFLMAFEFEFGHFGRVGGRSTLRSRSGRRAKLVGPRQEPPPCLPSRPVSPR